MENTKRYYASIPLHISGPILKSDILPVGSYQSFLYKKHGEIKILSGEILFWNIRYEYDNTHATVAYDIKTNNKTYLGVKHSQIISQTSLVYPIKAKIVPFEDVEDCIKNNDEEMEVLLNE